MTTRELDFLLENKHKLGLPSTVVPHNLSSPIQTETGLKMHGYFEKKKRVLSVMGGMPLKIEVSLKLWVLLYFLSLLFSQIMIGHSPIPILR